MEYQESDIHAIGYAKEIYTDMLIDDKKISFRIDCGVAINIIRRSTQLAATGHEIQKTTTTLRMWNGSHVKPIGTTRIVMHNPKTQNKLSVDFVVVDGNNTFDWS